MEENRKVIITGAAGFIGSHVAQYFCEKSNQVACCVKRGSNLKNISSLPVEIIYVDITDLSSLKIAFQNAGFVIHIAALAKDWGADFKTFHNINVEGTLNVLNACYENNIYNIIVTGTISSYGEESSSIVKNEHSPYNSHHNYFLDNLFPCKMNFYSDTKAEATRETIKFAEEKELNVTIIEPAWVYGEREFNTGFYEYMKTVKTGIPFMPGSKKNKFHVIYAGDLARAYYLAYKKRLQGFNRIIIGNRNSVNMDEMYSLFCRELGVVKPMNLPRTLTYPIGFLMELFYTLFDIKSPPLLSRGRVDLLYNNIEYSTEKAEKMLSFINQFTLEEGIKRTVKWYKDNKYL
jgi:nucleoside-diphosphate-sugar epimerase